ncbi:MAG: hypothetical protein FWG42_10430 [Clostridiales bacterium]|nr:hypothetical protein [Clostridiales bacterium]
MIKKELHITLLVTAALLTCVLSASCAETGIRVPSGERVAKAKDYGSYNRIMRVGAENMNALPETDIPFDFSGYARINEGEYVFYENYGYYCDGEIKVYSFNAELGVTREATVDDFNATEMAYDAKHQLLLFKNNSYHYIKESPPIFVSDWTFLDDNPAILVALDMNLDEQWRVETNDHVSSVAIRGDCCYVSKNQKAADSAGEASPRYDAIVDKIGPKGELVATFKKSNFRIHQIINLGEHSIIYGEQTTDGKREAVVMKEDSERFFSDNYSVVASIKSPVDFLGCAIGNEWL